LIAWLKLPGGFPDTGQFALVRQFAEANAADAEIADVSVIASTTPATSDHSGGKLRLSFSLNNHCFSSHII
jgi:hypothetical protein